MAIYTYGSGRAKGTSPVEIGTCKRCHTQWYRWELELGYCWDCYTTDGVQRATRREREDRIIEEGLRSRERYLRGLGR